MKATLTLANHKIISWNQLYSIKHWAYRKKVADDIHQLVWFESKAQEIPHFDKPVKLFIHAGKKSRPLDCSNICEKLYEDGLVHAGVITDDNYKRVVQVTKRSVKSNSNWVEIEIEEV